MALSDKQMRSICESTRRFNLWVGAVRSGKTFASILRFVEALKRGPPGDAMIIGVSRESIGRNVLTDLYKILGAPKPADNTNRVNLFNRNLYFVGAGDEGAVRRIQGATLAMAYVDEVACVPKSFFKMLESRLSIPGAQLFGTANPEGPAHWLKKEYIDRSTNEELDLVHWHFVLDDNPSLDDAYKDSLKASFTGMWYKRLILGEWAVSHGLIYDSFDSDNIYDGEIDYASFYAVGIDYGTSNATAAVLCAITPQRFPQIRVIDEYYYDSVKAGRQKTDDELADDIVNLVRNHSVKAVYVDPSAASLKLELRNRNLPVLDANNNVLEGIKVVSKMIANKNLQIHKSCKTLIEVLNSYCWDVKAAERGEDKPLKKFEHQVDALRYIVYTAFPRGFAGAMAENLTIEQIRSQVYDDHQSFAAAQFSHGYF